MWMWLKSSNRYSNKIGNIAEGGKGVGVVDRWGLEFGLMIDDFTITTAWLNSLTPGKFEWNFRYSILQIISVIGGWGISCELALRWMSLDLADDKSTLVQVMAWCRQAISHYLSQCWPRSLSPYGVYGPQCVKLRVIHSGAHSGSESKSSFSSNMLIDYSADTWTSWHLKSLTYRLFVQQLIHDKNIKQSKHILKPGIIGVGAGGHLRSFLMSWPCEWGHDNERWLLLCKY